MLDIIMSFYLYNVRRKSSYKCCLSFFIEYSLHVGVIIMLVLSNHDQNMFLEITRLLLMKFHILGYLELLTLSIFIRKLHELSLYFVCLLISKSSLGRRNEIIS